MAKRCAWRSTRTRDTATRASSSAVSICGRRRRSHQPDVREARAAAPVEHLHHLAVLQRLVGTYGNRPIRRLRMDALQLRGDLLAAPDLRAEVDRAVVLDRDGELARRRARVAVRGRRHLYRHAVHHGGKHEHEDDEENEADVDERGDVDVRFEGALRAHVHAAPPARVGHGNAAPQNSVGPRAMERLRIITYLSPSIPAELYELIARDLGEQCGVAAELAFEQRISGPLDGDDNLFAGGAADIGFLCAPSFRWLNATRRTVELLPLPVPSDARAAGRPVYFADVVVRDDSPARTFAHLSGARWSFNDRNSKSGWFSMLERIAPRAPEEFFGEIVASGSHLQSLELVASGAADAAAIDSN